MNDLTFDPKTGDLAAGVISMGDALLNNVCLSLSVPMGGWWAAPKFGGARPAKLPSNAKTVEGYCRGALEWITATGRARTIDITAELDKANCRVNCLISVTRNDGSKLDYTHYVRVG